MHNRARIRNEAGRSIVARILFVAAALSLGSFVARAADTKKDFAGYTKFVWYHAHYDVNADGTHVETQSWALKVLSEQGVSEAQQMPITYSNQMEKLEIL